MRLKTYLNFITNFDQLNKNSNAFLLKKFTLNFKNANNEFLNFFSELKGVFFFSFLCTQNCRNTFLDLQFLRSLNLCNCLDIFFCSTFLHRKSFFSFCNSFIFFNENFYKLLNFQWKLLQTQIVFSYNSKDFLKLNLGE